MIDTRHEGVKLAVRIDREVFEGQWAGFFPSGAGLLDLQHAYRLSDEPVVARWVEYPCYRHFTGAPDRAVSTSELAWEFGLSARAAA